MRRGLLLVGVALLLASPLQAQTKKLTAAQLAASIDEQINATLKAKKITPSPLASEAELVRRLYLDLNGQIPGLLAARDFTGNPAKDKRAKLIEKLLSNDRYYAHFANVWRSWLLTDSSNIQNIYYQGTFENWLRQELKSNTSYDKMVKELITGNNTTYTTGAYAFYMGNGSLPEKMAAATTRLFLGVKLECAQCHDHPFAKWKRQQFWEVAAFFTGTPNVMRPMIPGQVLPKAGEITVPATGKKAYAAYLDGKKPGADSDYRQSLADWITKKDNPYFARATVNRLWEYFMGTGLVEPVDEESTDNPASHPALLKLLAEQFAANNFDLKYLIRAITSSQTYQRSSKQTHDSQANPRLFARMRLRGLSPEQMYDSLALATGNEEKIETGTTQYQYYRPVSPVRADFLLRFPNQDKRSEQQLSILQALYLMNSKLVADATDTAHNKNLAIIVEASTVRTARKIDQLFLITLSRKATPAESKRLVKYVDDGGAHKDSKRALCDVFWALLNSPEFGVNH